MVGILIVLGALIAHQVEAMVVKHYGDKKGTGGMFFNAFLCLFAVVYFVISDKGGFDFYKGIWIYAVVNSLMFATGFYSMYIALKEGSFGLSRLIVSFTGVVSIFYGVVVLKEKLSVIQCVALVFIFVSIFLMRYQKSEKGEKNKFSAKWIIAMILTFGSNAAIGILGKIQQVKFDNVYKNEYLIITFAGSALWLFILGFVYERESFKPTVKTGLLYGFVAGICNGVGNWLALIANEFLNLSIVSPLKSGLSIVITFVASLIFYKEKFSVRQYIGAGIGVAAVVLMSI